MGGFLSLVVLATSIWMAADASRLGYDKRDVKGLAAMGPAGWLVCGLLLWIVAFPLYLAKRPELKAAGERRRQLEARGMFGQLPGAMPMSGPGYSYGPGPGYGHPPSYGPTYANPMVAGPYAPPPMAGSTMPGATMPGAPIVREDVVEQILKLDRLRVAGILTDEEFQRKKTELLSRT